MPPPSPPASLRVLVCSGNLGNAEPDVKSIEAWIPKDGSCRQVEDDQRYPISAPKATNDTSNGTAATDHRFDLIVLGLQESTFEVEEDDVDPTEVACTQTPLSMAKQISKLPQLPLKGAALKTVTKGAALTVTKNYTEGVSLISNNGTAVLHKLLQDRLPSYKRLLSFQRGEMRLLVFARPTQEIRLVSVRAQNTGMGGLANKGGIVAEVLVNETTNLTFVTCHLDAHEGIDKYKARLESIRNILKGTKQFAIPAIYPDVSLSSHFCFFLGDLNFRTRLNGRIHCQEQHEDAQNLIDHEHWNELYQADELKKALEHQECLYGFQTLDCNFPPTFKLQQQAGYIYKDTRTPSYTDRILFKTGNWLEPNVTPLAYEPIDQFTTSDHKPIRGAFEVTLNRPFRLPLRRSVRSSVFQRMHLSAPGPPHDTMNLHLYVSDIQMDLFPTQCGNYSKPPDTYLALVTNPQELLMPPKTLWQQCVDACLSAFCNPDEYRKVEWPRTPAINNSYNPNWGDDTEIHCKLRGHKEDGTRVQLGGALLHLFACTKFNGRGKLDEVLGSFPINLEYLYRSCLDDKFRADAPTGITVRDNTANPKMVSLDIDAPILKNGLQTGVIRCSLDAWWVKDSLAQAAKATHLHKGLASNVYDSHGHAK